MGREIERKFLVRDLACLEGREGEVFRQGYISASAGAAVRVRLEGERAKLTIKGETQGLSRSEFEYEIPPEDARQMLASLCAGTLIEKTRYRLEHGGKVWEVDVFAGANEGLVLAEVELESEAEEVEIPAWAGEEVSDDPRYYNANLATRPFASWAKSP